jgi:hypothetical protein
MEYIGMNKYLCKSTLGFRKYNKMNTNEVMMEMQWLMMKTMPRPPRIFVAARIDHLMRVPPPDPF